jgi:hypothetical protein
MRHDSFWDNEFDILKPKRTKGNRMFTPGHYQLTINLSPVKEKRIYRKVPKPI